VTIYAEFPQLIDSGNDTRLDRVRFWFLSRLKRGAERVADRRFWRGLNERAQTSDLVEGLAESPQVPVLKLTRVANVCSDCHVPTTLTKCLNCVIAEHTRVESRPLVVIEDGWRHSLLVGNAC
jgi:hypothetical protein